MPSTWTQNFYHLVFSTKRREPMIDAPLEERLHPFLGGICRDLACTALAINGFVDHVHLAVRYPPTLSHADLARHVKARSSQWVHETFPALGHFAWQEGYGGFTVSKSSLPKLVEYIQQQKEHHRRTSFVDEFMQILHAHGEDASFEDVFRDG
jgi:REP element-mobilizing transposase RayT